MDLSDHSDLCSSCKTDPTFVRTPLVCPQRGPDIRDGPADILLPPPLKGLGDKAPPNCPSSDLKGSSPPCPGYPGAPTFCLPQEVSGGLTGSSRRVWVPFSTQDFLQIQTELRGYSNDPGTYINGFQNPLLLWTSPREMFMSSRDKVSPRQKMTQL